MWLSGNLGDWFYAFEQCVVGDSSLNCRCIEEKCRLRTAHSVSCKQHVTSMKR